MKLDEVYITVRNISAISSDSVDTRPAISGWRMLFFASGSGRISENDKWRTYAAGAIFLWRSIHNIRTEFSGKVYLLEFDFIPLNEKGAVKFEDFPELNSAVAFSDYGILSTEIVEMYNEFLWKKIFYRERASAILQKAVYLLIRSLGTNDDSVANKLDFALEYIHKHYSENITNEDIGRQVNYHPHYLNKLMVEYKGVTLHKYLTEFRINNAKIFIKTTDRDVGSIAADCGFINLSHFTKVFKNSTGMSPTEFRKKYRK